MMHVYQQSLTKQPGARVARGSAMSFATRTKKKCWAARARPLGDVDPLLAAARAGELFGYWELPAAGEAIALATPLADERAQSAAELPEVLARVADRSSLHWRGERVGIPGPWFGGIAFD